MTYEEKKALYESVMKEMAKVVKKKILESDSKSDIVAEIPYCEEIDKIALEIVKRFKNKLKKLTPVQVDNFFNADYALIEHKLFGSLKSLYNKGTQCALYENIDMKDWPVTLEKLQRKLKAVFGFCDWQFELCNPFDLGFNDVIASKYYKFRNEQQIYSLIYPDINRNIKVIENVLSHYGYSIIRNIIQQSEYVDEETGEPLAYVVLIFIDDKRKNIRNEIKEFGKLYHISLKRNENSILKNGIKKTKREGEQGIVYSPRVYFFRGDCKEEAEEYSNEIKDGYGEPVVLFTIDMEKLDPDISIYYDPLIGKNSVYIEHDVAPETIIEVEEL